MGRAAAVLLSDPVSWTGVVCVRTLCVIVYNCGAECGFESVTRRTEVSLAMTAAP